MTALYFNHYLYFYHFVFQILEVKSDAELVLRCTFLRNRFNIRNPNNEIMKVEGHNFDHATLVSCICQRFVPSFQRLAPFRVRCSILDEINLADWLIQGASADQKGFPKICFECIVFLSVRNLCAQTYCFRKSGFATASNVFVLSRQTSECWFVATRTVGTYDRLVEWIALSLFLCQFNAFISVIKEMVSKVESEHRNKLEQLNSMQQEQRYSGSLLVIPAHYQNFLSKLSTRKYHG